MIPGDLLSVFPHRQFHSLLGFLDSWAALPNSNPNACMPKQGGSLYHFNDGMTRPRGKLMTYSVIGRHATDTDTYLHTRSQIHTYIQGQRYLPTYKVKGVHTYIYNVSTRSQIPYYIQGHRNIPSCIQGHIYIPTYKITNMLFTCTKDIYDRSSRLLLNVTNYTKLIRIQY